MTKISQMEPTINITMDDSEYEESVVIKSKPFININMGKDTTTSESDSSGENESEKSIDVVKPKPFWKRYNFWIETAIFLLSVIGAVCISYNILKGFLLWFLSNTICAIYFTTQKQYPLALQQFVFLITTILGIIQNSDVIFKL